VSPRTATRRRGDPAVRTPRRRRRADDDGQVAQPTGIVAIVGRPNVGKSTLFNRLTGERRAIVDEVAGLTRDRIYGVCDWDGRSFTVVDTAGLDPYLESAAIGDEKVLIANTQAGARQAIAEADVLLFMVDVRDGVTALDEELAAIVRTGGKPVILAGNKADSPVDPFLGHELYRLGLGDPTFISALQGGDVADLCDAVVAALPAADEAITEAEPETLRIAIVGRPNVGKSSLLNALVGEERALVSPVPGTTRDVVDTLVDHRLGRVRLIDTAGIRRRGVVSSDVEHYSLLRSLRAIERCDVVVLVADAAQGIVAQDQHVAGYAAEAGKGLVIVVNKWDLLDEEVRADPQTLKEVSADFHYIPGIPVLAISALTGRGVRRILDNAWQVAHARATRVPTPALNQLLRRAVEEHPPRYDKGRRLKLLYATQAATPAPTFVFFVNDPDLLHFSYSRYLENRIRAVFGFSGVPLRVVTRKRAERADER
jgi:GTP-binding protein